LFIAFLVACVVIAQLCITKSNNDSTTQQTNQLIGAARINALASQQSAAAADSFADSTRKVGIGINAAVDRLNSQAEATSEIANQAAVQADAARTMASNTSEQLGTMERQLELSERPWLRTEVSIAGPLEFDSGGGYMTFKFKAFNSGRSPAVNVMHLPTIVVERTDSPLNTEKEKAFCNVLENNRPAKYYLSRILFPQTEEDPPFKLRINISNAQLAQSDWLPPGAFAPKLIDCTEYQSTFDEAKWYSTIVVYDIWDSAPDQFHGNVFMANEPVEEKYIVLTKADNPPMAK
jgi:hypothetical protein